MPGTAGQSEVIHRSENKVQPHLGMTFFPSPVDSLESCRNTSVIGTGKANNLPPRDPTALPRPNPPAMFKQCAWVMELQLGESHV